MNLHPLIVHFPIGLLVSYALAEVASLTPWFSGRQWVHFRGTLAIAGSIIAVITTFFGEIAEGLVVAAHPEKEPVIQVHSQFGNITAYLFLALAFGYALNFLRERYPRFFSKGVGLPLRKLNNILQFSGIRIAGAIVGLVTITITGGLGASIVYGADVDPFVHFIYSLFF